MPISTPILAWLPAAASAGDRQFAASSGQGAEETSRRPASRRQKGREDAGIAARLRLSLNTVKKHVGQVLAKLDARNRTHAVVLLLRR